MDYVTLSGSPRDRGVTHGERFAAEIKANVDRYLAKFSHYGISAERARELACKFIPLINETAPAYATEMQGIADGSGVPLADVALLNARYEITYGAYADAAEKTSLRPTDGCTSFGLRATVTNEGRPYIGQNWDWMSDIDVFMMGVEQSNAPNHVALTEAGIVGGKIGVNENGIGMTLNGLVSTADGEQTFQTPYHVRFRDVLNATRLSQAIGALLETNRACSANVLLGSEDNELIDLEILPQSANYLYPSDGVLTHANHLKGPEGESQLERILPDTLCREPRLRRLLTDRCDTLSVTDIKNALRDHVDHPTSICRHQNSADPEQERSSTRVSAIIDLTAKCVSATAGPPCQATYHNYAVSER
ncbi:C45 family autoproteolytic acyltransferase/hydolase [Haladaptatus salinisoli]|uniref:C45 family autoproteolytic acyltransferase/hydolase n=1 Tax=Haladaptatus salinisoli TaxID=2884876 RepID=UPI001D0A2E74|nr:C45 family peptidase [Haladaptatus salinisoli]